MQQFGYGLDYDRLALRLDIAAEEILRMSLKNELKKSTAQKIEDRLGIDKEWLLSGKGKIYKAKDTDTKPIQKQKADTQKEPTQIHIHHHHYNANNISIINDSKEPHVYFDAK
jgi:hypothetical protein